jgi:maintenance of mitochondrial morphology protein 1
MGYLLSLQPTFTQGLIIGQLSILVLLALVLKYLFLVADPSTSHHLPTTTATIPRLPLKQEAPREHSSESTHWLNVVLGEVCSDFLFWQSLCFC